MGTAQSHSAIERTVTGLNYELVDVERSGAGLLRVFIDRPSDGAVETPEPINVEDCERVTRQLQHVLEVEGVAYQRLEVSSPGLDRSLKRAADYERFAGQDISLTLKLPLAGRKHFKGRLQRADAGWQLHLAGDKSGTYTDRTLDFTLDEVREARLVPVIDFKGRSAAGRSPRQEARPGVDGGH